MKYKAIIFDVDDTLIQTRQSIWDEYKYVGKKYLGIEVTDETLRLFWGKPFGEVISGVLEYKKSLEELTNLMALELDNFRIKPYKEGLELLKYLKGKAYIGMITSSSSSFIMNNLINAGYDISDFNFTHTQEDGDFHKPDPRVFDRLKIELEKNAILLSETLFIGDSLKDMEATQGAGIDFIAVTTGLHSREDFLKMGLENENIYSSLSKIPTLI